MKKRQLLAIKEDKFLLNTNGMFPNSGIVRQDEGANSRILIYVTMFFYYYFIFLYFIYCSCYIG